MIDATAGGSRATLSVDYKGLFGVLIGRLTKSLNQRYIRLEADGLKRRSEAGRSPGAAPAG
jgi:hypothetical protein